MTQFENDLKTWVTQMNIAGERLRRDLRAVFADMDAVLAAFRTRRTPEQAEKAAEARYHRAIAAERRAGRLHVSAEAERVSRELGLRPEFDPRNTNRKAPR